MVDLLEEENFGNTINISTVSLLSDISFGDMDESKSKKNKMISKGMLIASIALAFVNPLWGLVGVAGTSAFNLSKSLSANKVDQKETL